MARPFDGCVSIDSGTAARSVPEDEIFWERREYLTVTAGTIAHIGLNFRPFYRYDEKPATFHILGIHASPVSVVRELSRIHRGQPMRPGKTYEALAVRARVSSGAPIRYMIDGDLHESDGELDVVIGPRVKLVVLR
jgi:hypothetical protein